MMENPTMMSNEQLAALYLRRLEQAWEKTAPLRERLKALAAGAAYDDASDDALLERADELADALADAGNEEDREDN
jgi:hypothetical protein